MPRSPSNEGSVNLEIVVGDSDAEADTDMDLDFTVEPSAGPLAAGRVGPLLDTGGVVQHGGAEGGGRVGDYIALSAAWNATQHQLRNHVGDGSARTGGRPYRTSTTSLLFMLQTAFARKEPRRPFA